MCYSFWLINSLNTNKFAKYSNILCIIQFILNCLIIIVSILCFISCNLDLIIKSGYSFYVNNIFFCFIMLLITILIKYYNNKNILIKDKKQTSFILICFCLCITVIKCFTTLISIAKIKRIYRSIKLENLYYYKKYSKLIIYKQANLLFIYVLILFGFFIFLGIFWLIYILLIYNLRIIILNNDLNNIYNNSSNISYISTKPDIEDNSQEIAINNLNDGYKNNNFIYFSKNVINKIEKEFEDKESQTNIKGIC